uniref:DRBM domain-containing protein n=1 Tax=Parastrongyloides trichosuri TaxID=131310 RepID=A0A0N4ZVZ7_PARTI
MMDENIDLSKPRIEEDQDVKNFQLTGHLNTDEKISNITANSNQKKNNVFNPDEWDIEEVSIPNVDENTLANFDFSQFRTKMEELFIDAYELEKKEPELFEVQTLEHYSDGFNSTVVQEVINTEEVKERSGYSFLSVLYKVSEYIGYDVKETSETIYSEGYPRQLLYNRSTIEFGRRKVTYFHPSKTKARHMCARDILYQLVEEGYYEKYGIRGKNREECMTFLSTIMPDLPKESVTNKRADRDRNPAMILNEFCQKRHFDIPGWEKDEIKFDSNNIPIHSGTLHLHIWKTRGTGRSIKQARNMAGEEMLKYIEEFEENNPLFDPKIFS